MLKRLPTPRRRTFGGARALFAVLLLAGCDQNATDPQPATPAQFFRNVSLTDLQNSLKTGTARVEVSIIPGGLVARRVEIEQAKEIAKPEEVRGQITAITWSGGHGIATLKVGGLQIAFDSSTSFHPRLSPSNPEGTAGHGHHGKPTVADFVTRIQAQLAAGHHAGVTARRNPAAQPQAPDDASFTASELQFDGGADHPFVALNVSAASLTTNPAPPPDAWLKLLGFQLELRVSDRTTQLKIENPRLQGVRGFEGIVQAVDQTGGTVTLEDGTIIRIVAGTELEPKAGPDDNRLTSLADVAAALAAGKTVGAEGKGLVDATSPLTLDAIKIEFEVE